MELSNHQGSELVGPSLTSDVVTASHQQSSQQWIVTSKYGRGKVVPVSRSSSFSQPSSRQTLRLPSVSQTDVEHGARAGDVPPRCTASMLGGWLQYIRLTDSSALYRAMELMRTCQPCVLQGSPIIHPTAIQHCTLDALGSTLRDATSCLHVECCDDTKKRFYECCLEKNARGSMYYVRQPETQVLNMTFKEFVECKKIWKKKHLLMKFDAMRRGVADGKNDKNDKDGTDCECTAVEDLGEKLQPLLLQYIDWHWLKNLRTAQRFGPVLRVEVQIGGGRGVMMPPKYETQDRLMVQVSGRRRVGLVSPEFAFQGMYPFPVHHTYDTYSMVDVERPDKQWTDFHHVKGRLSILQPGDVLFVPMCWFVYQEFLEEDDISMTMWLAGGTRVARQHQMALKVSRVVEEMAAEVEGVHSVRKWLQLIGSGDESRLINVDTLSGYRRVRLCQAVRDEVDAVLGAGTNRERGQWRHLLPDMCNGRLVDTQWLNKDCRDPLLLLDKPVVVKDTRSEEQVKYPQLFRHKQL